MSDRAEYERVAARIIAAYATISQWTARDFKRTQSPYGLTRTQLGILSSVVRGDAVTASQLAEHLELSVPTIVRALDALERKSLLVRTRSQQDRREVALAVTPEGNRVRAERERAIQEHLVGLLAEMDWDDVQALLRGFEAMAGETTRRTDNERRAG